MAVTCSACVTNVNQAAVNTGVSTSVQANGATPAPVAAMPGNPSWPVPAAPPVTPRPIGGVVEVPAPMKPIPAAEPTATGVIPVATPAPPATPAPTTPTGERPVAPAVWSGGGTVYDLQGKPVAGATVVLKWVGKGYVSEAKATTITNERGNYRFELS